MKRVMLMVLAAFMVLPALITAEGQKENAGSGVKVYRIAVSLPPANNSWQAKLLDSVLEEAEKDTVNYDFTVKSAVDDMDQLNMLQTFKGDNYDMIICLPGNGTLMTPVCESIYDAGIKLMIVDRAIASDKYTVLYAGDNYACGVNAARYFGQQLGGKGDIVALHSYVGIPIDVQRFSGFADTLKKEFPGIHILVESDGEFNQEAGLKATSNILPALDHIDAIYTQDDETAIGAITAVENAGRKDVKFVTGMGGAKSAYRMLQDKHPLFTASMSYFPTMGGNAVRLAKEILMGASFEKDIITSTYIVTSDNVNEFMDNAY